MSAATDRLKVDLLLAVRSLQQHGRRSAFLGVAIAAVTAFLILLTALSAGISETMLHSATTLMTGHVNVGGFFKVTPGQSAPVVTDYARVIEIVRRAVPELRAVSERGRGWAKVVSDTGSLQLGIGGIDVRGEVAFKDVIRVSSGSLDDLARPATILLFEDQAERLSVKVGDALTLSAPTTRGTSNTLDVRVAAIAASLGILSKWNAFIPSESLRLLYQLRAEATGAVHVLLPDADLRRVPAIAARLRDALTGAGYRLRDPDAQAFWLKFDAVNREDWTGQKLDVTTWQDELSFMTWVLQAVDVVTFVLIAILLGIVVVGIMNTMWIAIRERTREIGTLRAIGMQRGRVMWMFMLEALVLGLGATALGAAIGCAVAFALDAAAIPVPLSVQLVLMSDRMHLAVHARAVAFALGGITAVTGIAALWPALRAARLRPVSAMQHFG